MTDRDVDMYSRETVKLCYYYHLGVPLKFRNIKRRSYKFRSLFPRILMYIIYTYIYRSYIRKPQFALSETELVILRVSNRVYSSSSSYNNNNNDDNNSSNNSHQLFLGKILNKIKETRKESLRGMNNVFYFISSKLVFHFEKLCDDSF